MARTAGEGRGEGGPASGPLTAERAAAAVAELLDLARSGVPTLVVAHGELAGLARGFVRSLLAERPGAGLRVLDVAPHDRDAAIATEAAATDGEPAVRWVGGRRHVVRLGVAEPGPSTTSRPGAVVISGGTGALGLLAARWAVKRGATELLLLSRRGMPTDALAAELGVPIHAPPVDVTDAAAVRAAFGTVAEPIRGVIHAAGVLADALVDNVTAEQVATVFGPKVGGLMALEAASDGLDLDLFVVFSSVTAALGTVGQAVYGAANAVVEGIAARRPRALAIQWGPWAGAGMAADLVPTEGMTPLRPREADALFDAAFRHTGTLLVARMDARRLAGDPVPHVLRDLVGARAPVVRGPFATRIAALPEVARRDAVRDAVREDVTRVLSVRAPADDAPLRDLGMDSLLAIELRNVLAKRVGERLPATIAFDHGSVDALAGFLLGRLGLETLRDDIVLAPVLRREPIAIVGMACRFPGGANDPEAYWNVLQAGVPVAGPIPAERWDQDAIYQAGDSTPGKTYARAASFVDDLPGFDAAFFGISDAEAASLDPQQRLLLEVGWEALEDAGLRIDGLRESRTGVYVGATTGEWRGKLGGDALLGSPYALTGLDPAFLTGRLSYVLGLRGPAQTVSTACSSALVAVHEACKGLLAGDCGLALAAGVNLLASAEVMVMLAQTGALAADGTCKTFDAAADGFGRAEGCGVLVLERLSDARANGHRVLAVIEATATNHDGRASGLTAPSGPAQQALLRQALATAGRSPAEVDFLECHGTGTVLGDPIELRAAGEVLGVGRERPLLLGAAKAIVGHLESAAAMAGILKVILAFRHRGLPPNPVRTVNPELPLDEFALELVTAARPWDGALAGVSAFGLSGTNAHVLLARPPADPPVVVVRGEGPTLWAVSGRHEAAVHALARALPADADPRDVAAALLKRAPLELRGAVLRRPDGTGDELVVREARGGPLAFVFSGQGSQRPGMAADLYVRFPVFRHAFDAAIEALGVPDLRELLFSGDERIHHTAWTQPALFAVQIGQAALWRSLGIVPDVVLGHSIGELAAAVTAGVLDLGAAARLAAVRGRLMGALPTGGAMVAIAASEAEVREQLLPGVDVAAVNGPRAVVISGDEEAVLAVAGRFARSTRLTVSHAFHSHRVEPALAELRAAAAELRPTPPTLRWVPTARSAHPPGTAGYWVDQARGAVTFRDAVVTAGAATWVELGGAPVLLGMVGQSLDREPLLVATSPDGDEVEGAFRAAGVLWSGGHPVDLAALLPAGRRIALPTTPWVKTRYWPDPPEAAPVDVSGVLYRERWVVAPTSASGPRIAVHILGSPPERVVLPELPLSPGGRGPG